jgi:hypothetical protein
LEEGILKMPYLILMLWARGSHTHTNKYRKMLYGPQYTVGHRQWQFYFQNFITMVIGAWEETSSREDLEKWEIAVGNCFLFQQVREKQPREWTGFAPH